MTILHKNTTHYVSFDLSKLTYQIYYNYSDIYVRVINVSFPPYFIKISKSKFFNCRFVALVAHTNNHRSSEGIRRLLPEPVVELQQPFSCNALAKYKHKSFHPST